MPPCHADASAKIESECLTPCPSPSFTPAQIAAAEAALSARGVEEAEHAPRLLAHMAVYAAGLWTPLFGEGTQTTLAAFPRIMSSCTSPPHHVSLTSLDT